MNGELTTKLDLDAIEARYSEFDRWGSSASLTASPAAEAAAASADDVPALIAEIRRIRVGVQRDLACVERWPDCRDGDYNPACCRFPKSCSCAVAGPGGADPKETRP